MTAKSLLAYLLPALLFTGAALLSYLLNFNGLYGQDAHEYLRQSKEWFAWLSTGAPRAQTLGDIQFSIGYPLAGALVRLVVGDAVLSLQIVSWLSFMAAAFLLNRLLLLLAHGSREDSRAVFVFLGLALAPVALKAGLTDMSDALGLALCLASFFFGLRWIEQENGRDVLFMALFMALAVSTRAALMALLLPLAAGVGWFLIERRRWGWLLVALLTGAAVLLPQCLQSGNVLSQHSQIASWSVAHFFQREFNDVNGGISRYWLPNIVYLFSPVFHPGFCLLLPGLLLLGKRTDVVLPAKRILFGCLIAYGLLLGGLSHQNIRFLLPAYALLLLILFPAWDRMYCYGFYFFKKLTWSILAAALLLQTAFATKMLWPIVQRNRLEQQIATQIRLQLKPGAVLYAFDMDVAMRTYLPDTQIINLWIKRYGTFADGDYVLYNEPVILKQWADKNPVLNWEDMQQTHGLQLTQNLPGGWKLYRLTPPY